MSKHVNCYFFRSENHDGFWVQRPHCREGEADFIRYEDCQFYSRSNDQIIKVVDRKNGVTYIPSPDCPYFQNYSA